MSAEKEYFLQGKYNRALNKIARLEEQLARTSSANIVDGEYSPNVERRDAEVLQEQVFLLQKKLEEVSVERDEALKKISNLGDVAVSAAHEITNSDYAGRIIHQLENNISALKKSLVQAKK